MGTGLPTVNTVSDTWGGVGLNVLMSLSPSYHYELQITAGNSRQSLLECGGFTTWQVMNAGPQQITVGLFDDDPQHKYN